MTEQVEVLLDAVASGQSTTPLMAPSCMRLYQSICGDPDPAVVTRKPRQSS